MAGYTVHKESDMTEVSSHTCNHGAEDGAAGLGDQ